MVHVTRRNLLLGGGAVALGAGFGLWGRYAIGGTFEAHVAGQLDLDQGVATEMLAAMRDLVGPGDYEARASGFLFATTEPSRTLAPRSVREQAIEAFVSPLFAAVEERPDAELAYAGARASLSGGAAGAPCAVLLPP